MVWGSVVLLLVPLLQLNVLAAEAYVGNNGNWNSRDLNLRRPLPNRKPDGVTQPIHAIPRPLPKPIEITTDEPKEIIPPVNSEIAYKEVRPVEIEEPNGRASLRPSLDRFNLQRRPIASPEPIDIPISSSKIADTPEPAPPAPEPIPIALEPIFIAEPVEIARVIPVQSSKTPEIEPTISTNNPVSTEDIEVKKSFVTLKESDKNPSSHRYLMPRPLLRPSRIQPQSPAIPTPTPILTMPVIIDEPKVEELMENPETIDTISSFIPETSSVFPITSKATTAALPPSTARIELERKPVQPKSDESYLHKEEPIFNEYDVPVEGSIIAEREPLKMEGDEPLRRGYVPISNELTRPRPMQRPKTPTLPSMPRPKTPSLPLRPTMRPTERSPQVISPTRTPQIPSRVKPTLTSPTRAPQIPSRVKPTPTPTTTKKPLFPAKSLIPGRTTTEAPITLVDYTCSKDNNYYAIENECDSYIECKSNIPMIYNCPDGLYFNSLAVWPEYPCAYSSDVQCDRNAIKRDPQPSGDCLRQNGLFPMPNSDCSKYLMCQEGEATVMDCPAGLVFNTALSACDWPANVPSCSPDVFRGFTCPAPPLEEDGTPSDIILKYRFGKSCKEYIACQLGHPRLLKCDAGLSFDEELEMCVDSEYVRNCDAKYF